MGIASGINHFVQSIFEVIQGIFAAVLHVFQFVLQSLADLGKSFVHFVEGTLGFAIRKFCLEARLGRLSLTRGGCRQQTTSSSSGPSPLPSSATCCTHSARGPPPSRVPSRTNEKCRSFDETRRGARRGDRQVMAERELGEVDTR